MAETERITRTKELTAQNWLEPDETLAVFGWLSSKDGRVHLHPLTPEDVAERVLSVDLSPAVPGEIRVLFRTAQGILLYGSFFYPLFALGREQLTRVCEAAIGEKFRRVEGPKERKRFATRLRWLHEQGHLADHEYFWWTTVRDLRNYSSHPEMQTLAIPAEVFGFLMRTAHAISCLFDPSLDFMSLWKKEGLADG